MKRNNVLDRHNIIKASESPLEVVIAPQTGEKDEEPDKKITSGPRRCGSPFDILKTINSIERSDFIQRQNSHGTQGRPHFIKIEKATPEAGSGSSGESGDYFPEDEVEPKRGRSVQRKPHFTSPLQRAESRSRKDDATIEVNTRPIEPRMKSRSTTFYEDPTDPCGALDDDFLEPCPDLTVRKSVSEILDERFKDSDIAAGRPRTSTFTTKSRRPTESSMRSSISPIIYSTGELSDEPHNLDAKDPASLGNKGKLPETYVSEWSRLPTEIAQQIMAYLNPQDFDSARHACRSWFISSLEQSLLNAMLKRGGWSSSAPRSRLGVDVINREVSTLCHSWLISKRISRECALGPNWKGNGLNDSSSPFSLVSEIDFTEVSIDSAGPDAVGTIFTISSCGRFLMAANGCVIYIYELNRAHRDDSAVHHPGLLRPVTSLVCPRRVLACSMDTSSNRYAIAALLDGRMGLVCDLSTRVSRSDQKKGGTFARERATPEGTTTEQSQGIESHPQGPSFLDRVFLNSSSSTLGAGGTSVVAPFVFPGIASSVAIPYASSAGACLGPTDVLDSDRIIGVEPGAAQTSSGSSSRSISDGRDNGAGINSATSLEGSYGLFMNAMPVESGPRSLYHNICSEDDPPRSIAICPQRRCVAFGCSGGIELHWVDALTGVDLNRWFPLTAASDYLFFLPPRKSIDSAKKLRLISSAASPGERSAIARRFTGASGLDFLHRHLGRNLESSSIGTFKSHYNFFRFRSGRQLTHANHYRAIPLSDGYHMLYTDPTTGLLCLGNDAPIGGPTKLLRKMWFQGPYGEGSSIAYASGADLSLGVKVVAAFGVDKEKSIWLYSVPADVFEAIQPNAASLGSSWLRGGPRLTKPNNDWQTWWPDEGLQALLTGAEDSGTGLLPKSIWPIRIRGQHIGTCPDVVDITIDSGPNMTIWALSKDGKARVWSFHADGDRKMSVVRDGTIREVGPRLD
ncbi:hypothetical protein BJ878DRAFT_423731 [Calycina marina]|uniref:F-box domain-containing protein n=1 Tax=Calycina marina TaxID=1763456 RepID=A0A9P8CDU2_9HELO|nr:hypothetical protein BJ878DRAFT_423731 [Calycina marina]